MRYCLYQRKDLHKYYQKKSQRFHILHGIDDPSMKKAFILSLPDDLASETFRLIKLKGNKVPYLSLGEILQHVLKVVEKLCDQHWYLKNFLKGNSKAKKACKQPDLNIKCIDEQKCTCPTKKKKHFKKFKYSSSC